MLKVLISASPEDFSEAFTKKVKEKGLSIKLKVWSRDDHARQGYDLYMITQRDFAHLDKIRQLPPPSKLIAIFSPSFKESFLMEETDVRFNGFIMGEVEERATRSVDLLNLYFNHHSLYPGNVSFDELDAPAWLLKRISAVVTDLKEVTQHKKVIMHKDSEYITIRFEGCRSKFSPEDFKFAFNPDLISMGSAISGVVLHRLFDNASTFLQITSSEGDSAQIIVQFRLTKGQKTYENYPKLFAILPTFEYTGAI